MEHLYAWFQEYPRAAIELHQIEDACNTTPKALNWNMVYLEKKGWLELDLSADCPPYVACSANITGAGVDLVEDGPTFNGQFDIGKKT